MFSHAMSLICAGYRWEEASQLCPWYNSYLVQSSGFLHDSELDSKSLVTVEIETKEK